MGYRPTVPCRNCGEMLDVYAPFEEQFCSWECSEAAGGGDERINWLLLLVPLALVVAIILTQQVLAGALGPDVRAGFLTFLGYR